MVNVGRSENASGIYFKGWQIFLFPVPLSILDQFWCLLYSLVHYVQYIRYTIIQIWAKLREIIQLITSHLPVCLDVSIPCLTWHRPKWEQRLQVKTRWHICCYPSKTASLVGCGSYSRFDSVNKKSLYNRASEHSVPCRLGVSLQTI